jgi:hypothetical protein
MYRSWVRHNRIHTKTFEKWSILLKAKAGKNFNRRNTLSILRINIFAEPGDWAKGDVFQGPFRF